MKIGLATLGFQNYTNEETAKLAAEHGFDCVQLFLAQKDSKYFVYNGRSDVSALTPQECRRIADAYRSHGLEIPSIGVYTNLIEPNDEGRADNIAYFEAMMRVANDMGIGILTSETGSVHVDGKKDLTEGLSEKAWDRFIDSSKRLVVLAEKYDVVIAFEPFFLDLLSTAKRARVYIEEMGSERIRIQLDPANLLEHNDVDEMFNQLAPYIACVHAKDRKLHSHAGVAAGQGDLDYAQFVSLCKQHVPNLPVIIEYVNDQNFIQAKGHLLSHV